MATISELVVKIVADTAGLDKGINDATKSIDGVGNASKDASGKAGGLVEQFGALKGALVSAGLIAAFVAVGKAIYDSVQAFGEAEIAAKRLDAISTMQGLSDGTERITALANELQNLIGVDGDLVVQLGAELIAQGKSVDQTEEMIRAASELSAMTGQDLSTSVRQLTTTYSGMAGQLGKTIPELKDLTEEELKNGGAVDVIMEKYGGLAATISDSVIPATNRLKEANGDLKETFGKAFAPLWIDIANGITAAINGILGPLDYMATHGFDRAFEELAEAVFGFKGATTLAEEAQAKLNKETIEANRVQLQAIQNEKDRKKSIDDITDSIVKMSDEDLKATRATLQNILMTTKGTAGLSELKNKIDTLDAELARREKKRAEEVAALKKTAAEKTALAQIAAAERAAEKEIEAAQEAERESIASATREADARKQKEADTVTAMIAAEDAISKAKADAYGDSIIEAAKAAEKAADAEIKEAERAAEYRKQIITAMYTAIESAAQSLTSMVMKGYQDEAAAAALLADQEKAAREERLAAKLAEMDAETQAKLLEMDAETQAYLIANGLMEQTATERLQAELDAAIVAGDTEAAAEIKKELDRTKYLEEQDKKREEYLKEQAKKKADTEAYAKKEELRIAKETEKTKAKAKYDADLYSWKSSLLLGIAQAAQAVIAQLTVPIAGPALAVAAGLTGIAQIAVINKNKPIAPALARGSDFTQGGTTLVGEEGPELVNMPRGASVAPNSRGGTGGGPTFIINSPVAVTPSVAAQEYTRMVRNLAFEGVL
jgi:hypothetical protein